LKEAQDLREGSYQSRKTVTEFAICHTTIIETPTIAKDAYIVYTSRTSLPGALPPEKRDEDYRTPLTLAPVTSRDSTITKCISTSTLSTTTIPLANQNQLLINRDVLTFDIKIRTPTPVTPTTYASISILGTTVPAGATIAITGSTLTSTFTLPSVVSVPQASGIVLNSQTLMQGSEATVEGTTYSLPTGASSPVLVPSITVTTVTGSETGNEGASTGAPNPTGSGGGRINVRLGVVWVVGTVIGAVLGIV
jgi:hypothetical protein